MPIAPIWRDRFVTLGSGADNYDFVIQHDGAIIYTGRAWQRPGESEVRVRINDICADYLRHNLPARVPVGFQDLAIAGEFTTAVQNGGVYAIKDTVTFYADWSYDRDYTPAAALTDPVRRPATIDPRQHLLVSVINASEVVFTLDFEDSTQMTVTVPVARTADFNNDFNDDFSQQDSGPRSGAAVLDLSQWTGLASVSAEGMTWQVVPACERYALLYLNAYGGWDWLTIRGTVAERHSLERHSSRQDYDNASPSARGVRDHAIGITPEWTLTPGLLSDDESGRMHHLLESTDVWLLDFADMTYIPVTLTDTEQDVQTYRSNGRRPPVYTITAQLAQDRIRR